MFTFNLIHDLFILGLGFFFLYCLRGLLGGLARGLFGGQPLPAKFGWPSLFFGLLAVYFIFYLNHWLNP
jgi:hypothetical protein